MQDYHYYTIVLPTRLQTDTVIAIFLLKFFGKERFPGIETATVKIQNHISGDESSLRDEGILLLDMGGGVFDHHAYGNTASYLVAKELDMLDNKAIEKMLQLADRDDRFGKGTISNDPLDRAFGLPGLIMSVNKSMPDDPDRICKYMMPLLWGHYSEEWRRNYGIPDEYQKQKEVGKVKEFTVRHKGKNLLGVYIFSDNQSMAGWLRSQMGPSADVVIIENSNGYINMLTKQVKRIDLRMVISLLRQEELKNAGKTVEKKAEYYMQTGRMDEVPVWYYDTATNSILNATGTSQSISPTTLSVDTVISSVEKGLNEFERPSA
ncbi:MAG: hypothetical protein HGB03_02350 [Candidatus Yonathbacteria bacterium]|nr:hypothetical protein [Candidatus Yonathbacteria bacterium]NTW47518.1 hypothetical protein [Candidatus Yonathbacteria bacterium]